MSNERGKIGKRGGGGRTGSFLPFLGLMLLFLTCGNARAQQPKIETLDQLSPTPNPYAYSPHETTLGPYAPKTETNAHESHEKLLTAQEEMLAAQKKFLETQKSFLAMQDTYAPKTAANHSSTVAPGYCAPSVDRNPYYIGVFGGAMFDADLVTVREGSSKVSIASKNGTTGGLTIGYNFDEFWGVESRVHFSSSDVYVCADNTSVKLPGFSHELTVVDASVIFSPINTAKWQPYVKCGLGIAQQKLCFTYRSHHTEDTLTVVTLPVGVGTRFWLNERMAIHADVTDNIVFGTDGADKVQNHVALTVGVVWAFGGR